MEMPLREKVAAERRMAIMRKNTPHLLFRLASVLLLCVLVTLLLVPNTAGRNVASVRAGCLSPSAPGAIAGQQVCYSLDTSRAEWLQPVPIYLPVIIKGNTS
jgi:hypothetical protein